MNKLKFLLSTAFVCILLVLCTVASSAEAGEGGVAPASISTAEFDNAIDIELDSVYEIELDENTTAIYFKFRPTVSGFYRIESISLSIGDPVLDLYNNAGIVLESADDFDDTYNFRLDYYFAADVTYYFVTRSYGEAAYYSLDIDQLVSSDGTTGTVLTLGNTAFIEQYDAYRVKIFRVYPTASGNYMFFSSNNDGDPEIRLFNSQYQQLATDDQGGGSNNFNLIYSLTAGQHYYIVANHFFGFTGEYTFNSLVPTGIIDESYYFKNVYSSRFMAIEGPTAESLLTQVNFMTEPYLRWDVQKQSDGWYTLRSQYGNKKYIGVSTSSIQIDLQTTVSNSSKWMLFEDSAKNIYFVSKAEPNQMIGAFNTTAGKRLYLYNANSGGSKLCWIPAHADAFLEYRSEYREFDLQTKGTNANDSTWLPLIQYAVSVWNDSNTGVDITLTEEESAYSITVGSYPEFPYAGWVAPINNNNDILHIADIYINTYVISSSRNYRRSTIAHEIGHLLGLEDNPPVDGDDSLMNGDRDRSYIYHPQEYDIHNILFTYD